MDYFILRLSELEFRVRQTENYIKYADELKELKGHKEAKRASRNTNASEKIEGMERKQGEFAERLSALEGRFTAIDKDIRQSFQEFESKYVK